ncbi:hypothetical protein, partial [Bradyrhizobium diazoefficiens]
GGFALTVPSIGERNVTILALTTAATLEVCSTAFSGNHPKTATIARPMPTLSRRRTGASLQVLRDGKHYR